MAKERTLFADGAGKNGTSKEKATEIFDLMGKIRGIRFQQNALRRVCAHFLPYGVSEDPPQGGIHGRPARFGNLGNQAEKILKYIAACKDNDIEVRQPDVQVSRREFIVRDEAVVYGLGGDQKRW